MKTIRDWFLEMPSPFKEEAIQLMKDGQKTCSTQIGAIIFGIRGDKNVKHFKRLYSQGKLYPKVEQISKQPDPRPEMVMPSIGKGDDWCITKRDYFDSRIGSGSSNYRATESDCFTEQFQGFKDGTINHSEYLN